MSVSTTIKSMQDLMRKDTGVDSDAQRIGQLAWIFFLKIFDDHELELELLEDNYVFPIPEHLRCRTWAADAEGITGAELLDFIKNDLFKAIWYGDGDCRFGGRKQFKEALIELELTDL